MTYAVQDDTELSAKNKQESNPEVASQNKETTIIKQLHSEEETAEINPINDTAEQEVPASDMNDKIVIEDDGKFNQEEAKQIEEATKSMCQEFKKEKFTL